MSAKRLLRILFLSVGAILCVSPGLADAVQWNGNGHWYELVEYPAGSVPTWDEAQSDAETRVWLGHPGFLATLTSPAENEFVTANILNVAPVEHYWIGGRQLPGSGEPSGGWEWITGEPWSYKNWAPGEPNNAFGNNPNQDALAIFGQQHHTGQWNDIWNGLVDESMGGYVVEHVPEPTTAFMLAIGFILASKCWRHTRG